MIANQVQSVAESVVAANMDGAAGVTVAAHTFSNPLSVAVDVTLAANMFIMDGLSKQGGAEIKANAVARVVGGTPVCVIGLDEVSSETVSPQTHRYSTTATRPLSGVWTELPRPQDIRDSAPAQTRAGMIQRLAAIARQRPDRRRRGRILGWR